jgi:glycerol-3-phosphate dehydrogenase (NAD(P)+)
MSFETITILGAGAWGTALATVLARAGRNVTLWGRNARAPKAAEANLHFTQKLDEVVRAQALLLAVPAQAIRDVCQGMPALLPNTPVIVCAKGIERGTGRFMTQVIAETLPQASSAILSGPSFADEVVRGLPTAVTLAAADEALAQALALACSTSRFRVYHSADVRGVEIGGAAKNVLAIASGIVAGRKLGANAAAALISRGFAELARFGRAYGARPETLMGLSGLGDLVLTCSGPQSRNFALGLTLAEGRDWKRAAEGAKLAEGASTAAVLVEMARAENVDMPIASAVAAVLDSALSIDEAIETLLARPLRAEG